MKMCDTMTAVCWYCQVLVQHVPHIYINNHHCTLLIGNLPCVVLSLNPLCVCVMFFISFVLYIPINEEPQYFSSHKGRRLIRDNILIYSVTNEETSTLDKLMCCLMKHFHHRTPVQRESFSFHVCLSQQSRKYRRLTSTPEKLKLVF